MMLEVEAGHVDSKNFRDYAWIWESIKHRSRPYRKTTYLGRGLGVARVIVPSEQEQEQASES